MSPLGRILVGLFLLGMTYVLSALGSLAIDPAIGPWGLIGPLLFTIAASLLAFPMHRLAAPLGRYRWLSVAFQLALPVYVAFVAIHFYVTW